MPIRISLMSTEDCEEVIVKSDPVSCTSVGSDSVHLMEGLFSWAENATEGFCFEGTHKRPGWTGAPSAVRTQRGSFCSQSPQTMKVMFIMNDMAVSFFFRF